MEIVQVHREKMAIPEYIFIIIAIVFYLMPYVQVAYREVSLLSSFIYMAYCYQSEFRIRKFIIKIVLLVICLILLFIILTDSTSISENVSNRFVKILFAKSSQYFLMFMPLFFFYRVRWLANEKQIKYLVYISMAIAVMFLQSALAAVAVNAEALHSFRADAIENTGFNGFIFVYAYTFLLIVGVELFRMTSKRHYKLFFLCISIACLYFLVKAQYALSIVTTFLSCLYLYLQTSKRGSTKFIVVICLIIIALLLPLLLKLAIALSPSSLLNERLEEVYNGITGEKSTADSDMESRFILYKMALEAFFSSPILGNRSLDFNPHSTFLSIVADLGVAGGFVIYRLFRGAFSFMKSIMGEDYTYFLPLICQILLMGFTNPIHSAPSNFIMLWFVAPLLIHYYKNIVKV